MITIKFKSVGPVSSRDFLNQVIDIVEGDGSGEIVLSMDWDWQRIGSTIQSGTVYSNRLSVLDDGTVTCLLKLRDSVILH